MDLRQLRYFIAVAEELHFGRAAERLFISQPALSFDIKKLEQQLDTQLLIRTNKSVSLTNAGRILLDEARHLLAQADQARNLTIKSAQGFIGQLQIGFVNSMLYKGLPQAVARFKEVHPAVEVTLMDMNSSEQILALQRRRIDLGFAHWSMFPDDLVSECVLAEPFVCCLPNSHPLAHEKSIDLALLKNEGFILFPRRSSPHYHDRIIAQCVEAGFSPTINYETRLWQTVVAMVTFKMGIALVPQTIAHSHREGVVYIPLQQAAQRSETHALYRKDTIAPSIAAFIDILKTLSPNTV